MLNADSILDAGLMLAMLIALSGGILSFLSPCVLPIVPPYLAYMGGVSIGEMQSPGGRGRVFLAAVFFVLGLSTVFLFLGLAASALGRAFLAQAEWFVLIAGVLIMVLGAHFLGVFRLGFLDRELRVETTGGGGSAFGAYLLGLAFAFGWTPCLGPVLGMILGLAATEADFARGALLLGVYALGLGVPFLLVAAFFSRLSGVMSWMKRHLDRIERISGLLLWTVGLLMLTGQFQVMSFWLVENVPFLAQMG